MTVRAQGLRLVDALGHVLAQGMYHRRNSQWRVHAVFDAASEADAEALIIRLAAAMNGTGDHNEILPGDSTEMSKQNERKTHE